MAGPFFIAIESAKVIEESAKRIHGSIRNIRRSLQPTLLDEIGLTRVCLNLYPNGSYSMPMSAVT
jgi:glucose-6-phosphate-specific signal transduction histidine kinase